jgi:hypothetical protein
VSKEAYYTLLGVKADRSREVIGIYNFLTEGAGGWEDVLEELKRRGALPSAEATLLLLGGVAMSKKSYHRKVPKLDDEQTKFR